jgi:16S rRNA (guanine966-N2)-methyltransferase
MRIIAGCKRGLKLRAPEGDAIRPTSDKVRGAVFNMLAHGIFAGRLEGARVADIFCGTGAFACEALSRGAAHVTLVDQSREALALAKLNAARAGFHQSCDLLCIDATRLPRTEKPYDLVFLDPPYRENLLPPALAALTRRHWLNKDSLIVAENAKDEKLAFSGFDIKDQRAYGKTLVTFLSLS